MEHLDLLVRRPPSLEAAAGSCRLVDLENQILGVEREGDLPGEMIPYCYFEFLRTQRAFRWSRSSTTTPSISCRWPA